MPRAVLWGGMLSFRKGVPRVVLCERGCRELSFGEGECPNLSFGEEMLSFGFQGGEMPRLVLWGGRILYGCLPITISNHSIMVIYHGCRILFKGSTCFG